MVYTSTGMGNKYETGKENKLEFLFNWKFDAKQQKCFHFSTLLLLLLFLMLLVLLLLFFISLFSSDLVWEWGVGGPCKLSFSQHIKFHQYVPIIFIFSIIICENEIWQKRQPTPSTLNVSGNENSFSLCGFNTGVKYDYNIIQELLKLLEDRSKLKSS